VFCRPTRVPLQPRSYREAFGYGYGGGTPATTYGAILRCALGDASHLNTIRQHGNDGDADGELISQLWEKISTTKGPLRMSWAQVQQWARANRKAAAAQA
jgi:hypothetical protein